MRLFFNVLIGSCVAWLSVAAALAQSVGIGTTTPAASAALDVSSTTQGLLLPRLSAAQRAAIASPALGLLVYQTDGTPGLYCYNGGFWVGVANGRVPDATGLTNYLVVTTLAGGGTTTPTGTGGVYGPNASFSDARGVAVDGAGNVYVACGGCNQILKITPAGLVSVLVDNNGLFLPTGIAVDKAGTVYVANNGSNLISKITPGGLVSTLAGGGTGVATDGQGKAASFRSPTGVALDDAGNVYVVDRGNRLIRKITPGGLVSTLAGSTSPGSTDGQGPAASFSLPWGIAADHAGNLYVTEGVTFSSSTTSGKIRKITPAGLVTTLAGGNSNSLSADGQGTLAGFNNPTGVAVDGSGTLYVADAENNIIRKITSGGLVSTLAGSGTRASTDGQDTGASFTRPFSIALDPAGTLYVGEFTGIGGGNGGRVRIIK